MYWVVLYCMLGGVYSYYHTRAQLFRELLLKSFKVMPFTDIPGVVNTLNLRLHGLCEGVTKTMKRKV